MKLTDSFLWSQVAALQERLQAAEAATSSQEIVDQMTEQLEQHKAQAEQAQQACPSRPITFSLSAVITMSLLEVADAVKLTAPSQAYMPCSRSASISLSIWLNSSSCADHSTCPHASDYISMLM